MFLTIMTAKFSHSIELEPESVHPHSAAAVLFLANESERHLLLPLAAHVVVPRPERASERARIHISFLPSFPPPPPPPRRRPLLFYCRVRAQGLYSVCRPAGRHSCRKLFRSHFASAKKEKATAGIYAQPATKPLGALEIAAAGNL